MCNGLRNMFCQSVGSTVHSAAGSWGGNTEAGSARKINNPGETKDGCLVEPGHPGGRNRWECVCPLKVVGGFQD